VEDKSWTRVEKLTAVGIVLAALAAMLTFFSPEIRELVGLENLYGSRPQSQYLLPTRLSNRTPNGSVDEVTSFPRNDLAAGPTIPAASIMFSRRIDIPTDAQPLGITASDFDGDGLLDLAVAIYSGSHVTIFRNTGSTGVPGFGVPKRLTVGVGPEGIASADLDADGRVDLVSANTGESTVSVLRNLSTPGSMAFQLTSRLNLPTPHRVAIADIDRDGMPDLVVTSNSAKTTAIFRHASPSGRLAFEAPIFLAAPDYLNFLALADLDGDGDVDLLVPLTDSHRLAVYYNVSAPGMIRMRGPDYLYSGALPDVAGTLPSGDGSAPVVVVGSRGVAGVSLYLRAPSGFVAGASIPTGNNPSALLSGDLDRDGRIDLVVANAGSATVTVLRNVTTGDELVLSPQQPALRTGAVPLGIILQDLDEDGFLDIITTNHEGAGLSIFMNLSG